jgi:DNA-binding transcriptional ArsR family regulator
VSALIERAELFAALGDPNRLTILDRLGGQPASASALGGQLDISRQAVAKHLRVLEGVDLVVGSRSGREVLYRVRPEPADSAARWLEDLARGWEQRLAAIKRAAEES